MRVSVIVSFFALFHILATHAMWESVWDWEPRSDTSLLAAFDEPLVAKTFETLEVSNVLVRHILPAIMANNMEWGMTVRADSLEAQAHAKTLSDTQDQDQEQIREQFLWSDLNTLNRNVLLSDLANAGFSYERAKCFRYSSVLLVLMAYHKSVLDKENEKYFRYFLNEDAKVKNEVDSILKELTVVLGAETLEKMKECALSTSEKTWNEIKTSREDSSLKEPSILPALIVCLGNIKGHDSVYKRVVKYVYRDLRALQRLERQKGFAGFHNRLELGFVEAGLMTDAKNFRYIFSFLKAVLDVIENRGLVFKDKARAYRALTELVQPLGSIDKISFESMASAIIKFCNHFDVCSQNTLPAGRALVVESMAWLEKMYRADQGERENYLLQVLSTLFSKLAKDDYATCYSLTGVYPPHVLAKNHQPARPPEQQPTPVGIYVERVGYPVRYSHWTHKVINMCGGGYDDFVEKMRLLLDDRDIDDIQRSNPDRTKEQQVQMLLKVQMMGNIEQLEILFADPGGRARFRLNHRR